MRTAPAARLAALLLVGLAAPAGTARAQPVAPRAVDGTVCRDFTGPDLLSCVRRDYARTTPVSYDLARDYLYGRNGQIGFYSAPYTGVYSGRSGPLGGGGSPTQIDTEHTWPRSLMPNPALQEGDMHNLFPTISLVNNHRGNLPFGEIDDAQTNGWYGPVGALPETTPPATNREAYSERLTNVRFEPREDHKGNVARVMAYFYTLYGSADASFWEVQRPLLASWNRLDPPDSSEVQRNRFIRARQGNDNPYILDTTLVRRAFAFATASEPSAERSRELSLAPSPTRGAAVVRGVAPGGTSISVSVFDVLGRRVLLLPAEAVSGAFARPLDVEAFPPGLYLVHVHGEGPAPFVRTLPLVRAR
jgi:hypothetical protein